LKPDVVILDLQMPIMSGLEAARHISRISPDTAMLMYTMHAGPQLLREAQKVGIRDVLSKSDKLAENLFTALKSVCSRT
jgi:DNA-binding NarL/FixJ family response regulator